MENNSKLKSQVPVNSDTSRIKPPVLLRDAAEGDVPFIFNSWLKSYRGQVRGISNTVYYQSHHALIEQLLKKCYVVVACNPADPSQIYGYIVQEIIDDVPVIHYAYVKDAFRSLGIFRQLFDSLGVEKGFYTHNTPAAPDIAAKLGYIYNPYLAYGVR